MCERLSDNVEAMFIRVKDCKQYKCLKQGIVMETVECSRDEIPCCGLKSVIITMGNMIARKADYEKYLHLVFYKYIQIPI